MYSLAFSLYQILLLYENRDSFKFNSSTWMTLFLFLPNHPGQNLELSTLLNRSDNSVHPCPLPVLGGKHLVFTVKTVARMLAAGFVNILCLVQEVLFHYQFVRVFFVVLCFVFLNHERMMHFVKCYFCATFEVIIWFLFFILLISYIKLIDSQILNNLIFVGQTPLGHYV